MGPSSYSRRCINFDSSTSGPMGPDGSRYLLRAGPSGESEPEREGNRDGVYTPGRTCKPRPLETC